MAQESSEARELSLVSKLEMRVALADTDEKLRSLLHTFLAPLLLKLGAESVAVRNKTIALCQHINTRVQSASIPLPVQTLVKQFQDVDVSLVRQFDLLYIRTGLNHLSSSERAELLPSLLEGIANPLGSPSSESVMFNLVLRLLPSLKLPEKDSQKDKALRQQLGITDEAAEYLSRQFVRLLLFTPSGSDAKNCPGLSEAEYKFMNRYASEAETWDPTAPGGLNLLETKATVIRFVASGAFYESERFFPAVIANADSNQRLFDVGDDILKRSQIDLEKKEIVEQLFNLYFGTESPERPPVRPQLRMKILNLLCKSLQATTEVERVEKLINDGLLSTENFNAQGLQGTKLRNQIFSFVAWFARMATPSALTHVGSKAVEGIKTYVSSEGWPSPRGKLSPAGADLRSLGYESVGLLLPKTALTSGGDTTDLYVSTLAWLFTSLACDNSQDQTSVSIEQSLGTVLNILARNPSEKLQSRIRPVLLSHILYNVGDREKGTSEKVVRSTRYTAVRFSNRCFPFSDPVARWIALLASGSKSPEIAEEGRKGLDPYWYRMLNPPSNTTGGAPLSDCLEDNSRYKFPQFGNLVNCIFKGAGIPNNSGAVSMVYHENNFPVYLNTVAFLRNILLWEALDFGTIDSKVEPDSDHRLDSIISTKGSTRLTVKEYLRNCGAETITNFLRAAAKGAVLNHGLDPGRTLSYFIDIASLAPDNHLEPILPIASAMCSAICSNPALDQGLAARIIGILGSHPSYPAASANDNALSNLLNAPVSTQAASASRNDGRKFLRGTILTQAYTFSRMSLRQRMDKDLKGRLKGFLSTLMELLEDSKESDLRQTVLVAIGQLGLGGLVEPSTLPQEYTYDKVVKLVSAEAKKGKELAIQTLGRISTGLYITPADPLAFEQLSDPLFALSDVRDIEVQFAVGEALSVMSVGWKSNSLIAEFDVDAPVPKFDIPSYVLSTILDKALEGCKAHKPSQKRASIIWLLCLIRYCGNDAEVQERLRTSQAAFLRLLSDRDELVQDTASRGLGLVYEMGNEQSKVELVSDLIQVFTADGSKLSGGKVTVGTELFDPGDLPTGDGSVTTYKDILNLASEVGNPSLVYRFMSLASDGATWASRAAFGKFGLSNVLSDSSVSEYMSQNPKLYPKLYRYMFDPNTNVQRSMKTIWHELAKDSNAVIDAHFDPIIEELLGSILNGKEWRVRQASCAAIADLIQSRPVEKYDKYLTEILTKTFRVIDDIKESVRSAAMKLGQALSAIVIRTLEKGDPQSKRAKLMLGHIIPFLLSQDGLESSSDEVRAFSIMTLRDIIKKSPGPLLSPFVPRILETFLLNLSSLESQAANYVHLNAEKYGMTGQDVDKMRLSGLRSSPLMEITETHLLDALDSSSMKEVADKLQDVLRTAVGMPSKVGCSRVIVTLCSKGLLFSPYADRFLQVIRAHVLDRNETVGASYSTAIGHLARLASETEVLKTIKFAKTLYFEAEEEANRAISAEVLNCLSKSANDRMKAVAATFLPPVFVGTHDTDSHVKEVFNKTWSDNVSGPRMVVLYMNEILELASAHLESARWAIKRACALGAADMVASLGNPIDSKRAEALWPSLQKALAGRTWEGKGTVLKGFVLFAERSKAFWGERKDIQVEMRNMVIREAKRNNLGYRPHALECLGKYAKLQSEEIFLPTALDAASHVLDQLESDSTEKMEVDSGSASSKVEETNCNAIISCLLECLGASITSTDSAENMAAVASVVGKAVEVGGRATHKELFVRAKEFYDRIREADIQMNEVFQASLLTFSDKTLFLDLDPPLEDTRDKRTTAIVSYLYVCQKAKIQPTSLHCQRLAKWLTKDGVVQFKGPAPERKMIDEALLRAKNN